MKCRLYTINGIVLHRCIRFFVFYVFTVFFLFFKNHVSYLCIYIYIYCSFSLCTRGPFLMRLQVHTVEAYVTHSAGKVTGPYTLGRYASLL